MEAVLLFLTICIVFVNGQMINHRPYMNLFVDEHNRYRLEDVQKFGADNMQLLEWNDTLSHHAAQWVDGCDFSHRPSGFNEGENLYYNTARKRNEELINDGMASWYEEIVDYNYDTNFCVPGKMCGHYTQMVWGTTKQVGCSMKRCPTLYDNGAYTASHAWYLACFYYPPGNWIGRKPYSKGKPCHSCDPGQSCDRGLCTDKLGGSPGSDKGQITVVGVPDITKGNGVVGNIPDVSNTGSTCVDGSKYCNILSSMCSKPESQTLMRKFCRKTCGFCGQENCSDRTTSCAMLKQQNLCAIPALRTSMERNCKKTCGFCNSGQAVPIIPTAPPPSVGNTGSQCVDKDPLNRCNTRRWQSFCLSKDNTKLSVMRKNCAKTCGFCQAPIDQGLADLITKIHNDRRRQQRASDMNMVRWNYTLAEKARDWVSTCKFPNEGRQSLTGIGQNLAFHTKRAGDRDMVNTILDSWSDEASKFDPNSNNCQQSDSCHFTQMVWAETTDIGCGFRRCSQLKWYGRTVEFAWYITCFYTPPGNRYNIMTGEFDAPFKRGPPCSRCERGKLCSNGLCSLVWLQSAPWWPSVMSDRSERKKDQEWMNPNVIDFGRS